MESVTKVPKNGVCIFTETRNNKTRPIWSFQSEAMYSSNFCSEASHLWSPKDRIKSQKILVLIGFLFSEFWHSINFVLSLISNKRILLLDYNKKNMHYNYTSPIRFCGFIVCVFVPFPIRKRMKREKLSVWNCILQDLKPISIE